MKFVYFTLAALLALALAVFSVPAFAAMQYDGRHVSVTFHDGPCTEPAIEQILSMSVPGATAKAASVTAGGQTVPGCWVAHGEKVVLVDAFGNGGYLPAADLKQLPAPLTEPPAPV